MTPPGLNPDKLLVLLDLSWWLSRAWHIGLEAARRNVPKESLATAEQHEAAGRQMICTVFGWLVKLLTPPMAACLAACLDPVGRTFRHELTAELPEERRYKANREERPVEYHRAANVLLRIFAVHRIPLLSASGFEGDDAIASAARLARSAGLDVAIVSADKDLASLVGPGVWQWAWGGGVEGVEDVRGIAQVIAKYQGPGPALLLDWLALVGDAADNIRGVDGVGDVWAWTLLATSLTFWDTTPNLTPLQRLFELQLAEPTEDLFREAQSAVRRTKGEKPNLLDDGWHVAHGKRVLAATERLHALQHQRKLARMLVKVQGQREQVALARKLVALRDDAPIDWQIEELPIGGWDLGEVQQTLAALGFGRLAGQIQETAKRGVHDG